jgi:hypothetical protein
MMKKPNGFQILLIREIKKKQKTFYKTVENRGQRPLIIQLVKSRLPPRADTPKLPKRQAIEGQSALARSIGIGHGFEILSAEAELGVNYVQAVEKVIPIGQYLSA